MAQIIKLAILLTDYHRAFGEQEEEQDRYIYPNSKESSSLLMGAQKI